MIKAKGNPEDPGMLTPEDKSSIFHLLVAIECQARQDVTWAARLLRASNLTVEQFPGIFARLKKDMGL